MKKLFRLSLATLMLLGFIQVSYAQVAVIVHPDNANELTERQVRNIFLGKTLGFPDGLEVQTFDLAEGLSARAEFLKKVLRKSEANLNSYWARMLFSSKGKPPEELASAEEVKREVSSNPNAIGYIDAADVDDSVRVIMIID